jgi:hypothetical protein
MRRRGVVLLAFIGQQVCIEDGLGLLGKGSLWFEVRAICRWEGRFVRRASAHG